MLVGCAHHPGNAPVASATSATSFAASRDYYEPAQGLEGQSLLTALNRIVRTGHRRLSYDEARDAMFADIDDPENRDTIECVYSGRRETGVFDRASALAKNLNTEHTWPQSLGAEGTAKADLHHLYPVDEIFNSRRGNSPYGEVKALDSFGLLTRTEIGRDEKGRQVFEPRDAHKGNVARAVFYFYVRYVVPGRGKLDLRNFKVEKETLIRWHAQDPVDEGERRRNEAIFREQGNRNPFIDHPEYLQAVGDFPG